MPQPPTENMTVQIRPNQPAPLSLCDSHLYVYGSLSKVQTLLRTIFSDYSCLPIHGDLLCHHSPQITVPCIPVHSVSSSVEESSDLVGLCQQKILHSAGLNESSEHQQKNEQMLLFINQLMKANQDVAKGTLGAIHYQ